MTLGFRIFFCIIMRILFVCTGNILRSPTAQGIARHQAKIYDPENRLIFNSAGIKVFYHKEEPDPRAFKLGTSKGVVFNNIFARQIEIKYFENNDLILAMTKDHVEHLKNMSDPKHHPKIRLLLEFCKVENSWHDEVIDPYYGQSQDISEVYHIIELAINNLFKIINPKKW